MQTHATTYREIVLTSPGRRDELLAEAEAALRQTAMARRVAGILVTRHDHHRYTLALDEGVPFGETHEQSLFYGAYSGSRPRR